jgi:dTDP-4-amino-4,6-dideoxygalactose transaminase
MSTNMHEYSKIWLSSPHMGSMEEEFVREAFETNWIAPLGPNVDGFEKDIQQYLGIPHAAALSSGTAALHLGLILLGVGVGDFVLCQSMTFSASANPIVYQGAIPVFIDSEPNTWNMCPIALERAIESLNGKETIWVDGREIKTSGRIKAILPVHLYGMPANMVEIKAIADHHEIPILEDAAEALGSKLDEKPCGTWGELGVLSFNGNKIITTSGGGALVSADEILIQKARFLATQARDPAPHYQHSHIGYNYRLSNVLAGIGRGQMQVLNARVQKRRAIFDAYCDFFASYDGITCQAEPDKRYFSNHWLTAILIDPALRGLDREQVRLGLEAENIEARPLWKPMHLQPVFKGYPYFGSSVCEQLFDQGLCLPSGSNLSDSDFERILGTLSKLLS